MKLSAIAVPPRGLVLVGVGLLVALGIAGCASEKSNPVLAKEKEDLSEYREATADALRVAKDTLASFDRTCGEHPCPPNMLETFNRNVQQLEVDSFKMRERAMAMKAVGEAYFQKWHEHLASIDDPSARQLAIERHDALQKSFEKIRDLSHQTREAFGPYIAGLHHVRNALEKDPNAIANDEIKTSIQSTRENGQKVVDGLDAILQELKADWAILKPIKSNT